ncbi:MAG TPA: YceI family protein [Saprospiraceae bacterium]|nr:YceI family protein [Saprospiraceae bacterium]
MKKIIFFLLILCTWTSLCLSQATFYVAQKGEASFISEAPLETIKAESRSIKGMINPVTREFAFNVKINSFTGFNSEIQRVHFLENYMEQNEHPQASFSGKLIEDIPFDTPGTYSVRAKGVLEIHGVSKERIIRGTITLKPGAAILTTDFFVPLADHGISIPKIVRQKIAEQINVNVSIEFVTGSKS